LSSPEIIFYYRFPIHIEAEVVCQTTIFDQYSNGQHQKSFSFPSLFRISMATLDTPKLLLQRPSVDIDEWGQEVGWDFEYQQIEPGQAIVSAYAFGTARCFATRGEFSHSVRQVGVPPAGRITLGLPDQNVANFRWCGTTGSGGDIVNFSLPNGFDGTSQAGFSGFALSFSEALLIEIAEQLGLNVSVPELIRSRALWADAACLTARLRRSLERILCDANARNSREAADLFHHGAATEILLFISGIPATAEKISVSRRLRSMRRALTWVEDSDKPDMSVDELCRHVGVSAPTLYRGFKEEFGISPQQFLHTRRLARARKELLAGDARQHITDIANRWGFWHMGQFAADYRRQFGELPSQTRSRIKKTKL
jgi:AraC family ethanolamine operon transcriptional activator